MLGIIHVIFTLTILILQLFRHSSSLEWILDVGSGSGVLGRVAIANARNVVSVEQDWDQVQYQFNRLVTDFPLSLESKKQARELPDDLMLPDAADVSSVNVSEGVFSTKFFCSFYVLNDCPKLSPSFPYHMIGFDWFTTPIPTSSRVDRQLFAGWRQFRVYREFGGKNLYLKAKLAEFNGTTAYWKTHPVPTDKDIKQIKDKQINPGSVPKPSNNSQTAASSSRLLLTAETHDVSSSVWFVDGVLPEIEAFGSLPSEVLFESTNTPFIPDEFTLLQRQGKKSFDLVVSYTTKSGLKRWKRLFCISINWVPLAADKKIRQDCNIVSKIDYDFQRPAGMMIVVRCLNNVEDSNDQMTCSDKVFNAGYAAKEGAKDHPDKFAKKTDLAEYTFTALLAPERFLIPPGCDSVVSSYNRNPALLYSMEVDERFTVFFSEDFAKIHLNKMVDLGDQTFQYPVTASKMSEPMYSALCYTPPRGLLTDKKVANNFLFFDENWLMMDLVGDDIYLNCYDPREEISQKFRYIVQGKKALNYRPGLDRGPSLLGLRSLSALDVEAIFSGYGIAKGDDSAKSSRSRSRARYSKRRSQQKEQTDGDQSGGFGSGGFGGLDSIPEEFAEEL